MTTSLHSGAKQNELAHKLIALTAKSRPLGKGASEHATCQPPVDQIEIVHSVTRDSLLNAWIQLSLIPEIGQPIHVTRQLTNLTVRTISCLLRSTSRSDALVRSDILLRQLPKIVEPSLRLTVYKSFKPAKSDRTTGSAYHVERVLINLLEDRRHKIFYMIPCEHW